MTDKREEGWYTDAYGRHEARWMSAGSPTKLVRDGGVESYDDPPDEEPSQPATMIVEDPPPGADDLRRADEAETVAVQIEPAAHEPLTSCSTRLSVVLYRDSLHRLHSFGNRP